MLKALMKINGRMNASSSLISLLALGILVGSICAEPLSNVRGITLSTHRAGRELGDPAVLRGSFAQMKQAGANWVAVHPYARIQQDGTVSSRGRKGEVRAYWTEPIRVAHEMGLKVCIKPHLAHWRSGFSWRGEIGFDKPEEWDRFWEGYITWIFAMADACADADLFIVGTELDRTVGHESEWRSLISRVRARKTASVTFASNWDSFENVPF